MTDAKEIAGIASETGFSEDAVRAMTDALRAGNGTMAQFNHSEFGGFGQWSAGGMLMIGDMFNNQLKSRVATLADRVSGALSRGDLPMRSPAPAGTGFGSSGQWWPDNLGQPSSSGAQNGVRYAVFPATSRLAIESGGRLTVHDTGEHRIGGVSQQQRSGSSLRFSSQLGSVEARDLPVVDGGDGNERTAQGHEDRRAMGGEDDRSGERRPPAPSSDPSRSQAASFAADDRSPASFGAGQPDIRSEVLTSAMNAASESAPLSSQRAVPERSGMPRTSGVEGAGGGSHRPAGDPMQLLRGLAELRSEGILTEEEFAAKKAELLARL
ncbi:SHOCT domain-containing protein [Fulvimarina sp. 2208YS6-2-32]|uniref:SHOCT domain-containing protein n=1 Tax=Fulvimarina uroteuthidis TaxID=3098149 RepID=A0ABU5HZX4_9HYPH|nr:SHOCT domain-containing protein [Fulvimarina sp. 2208YS6-2-32]MDY8108340.1 SHOCT domain-containing protein [Fulvimarina sp. 2208YS6-2-32]